MRCWRGSHRQISSIPHTAKRIQRLYFHFLLRVCGPFCLSAALTCPISTDNSCCEFSYILEQEYDFKHKFLSETAGHNAKTVPLLIFPRDFRPGEWRLDIGSSRLDTFGTFVLRVTWSKKGTKSIPLVWRWVRPSLRKSQFLHDANTSPVEFAMLRIGWWYEQLLLHGVVKLHNRLRSHRDAVHISSSPEDEAEVGATR